jgi:hypothetical protein
MTTTLVRQHHRRKPERSRNDPFKEMIDARKAILAARIKPREQWDTGSGYRSPGIFRGLAEFITSLIGRQ